MSKSPEEYFAEHAFQTEGAFTQAEREFLDKYVGTDQADILQKLGLSGPAKAIEERSLASQAAEPETTEAAGPSAADHKPEEVQAPEENQTEEDQTTASDESDADLDPFEDPKLEKKLKTAPEIRLVGFTLGAGEYTIPIAAVKEVVRAQNPTKIPEAPAHLAGIINLRGRVTPLIRLSVLLNAKGAADKEDRFVVVVRRMGLQAGLLVNSLSSMYRVKLDDIEWNLESRIGGQVELVSGLMKKPTGDLVGILSVDRVLERSLSPARRQV